MKEALELLGSFMAEQWGLVTSKQASGLGVDAVTLFRLKEAGFLEQVRRGVYAGTAARDTGTWEEQAAWLALRPDVPGWERDPLHNDDGVMSHGTAARLHGFGDLTNSEIAMTTPRRRTSRDPDLRFKAAKLEPVDVTLIDGLPATTVLRTVCDLLDQRIDASHVATIIKQAVLADQLRLDALAERIAPFARRYRVRPGDGDALLEHLLEQIGVSVSDLLVRPAPAPMQIAAASQALARMALAQEPATAVQNITALGGYWAKQNADSVNFLRSVHERLDGVAQAQQFFRNAPRLEEARTVAEFARRANQMASEMPVVSALPAITALQENLRAQYAGINAALAQQAIVNPINGISEAINRSVYANLGAVIASLQIPQASAYRTPAEEDPDGQDRANCDETTESND
ncbi:type IV toxin-antitoxin system AbiEi family antitoxin domain-containing protein [Amycolatopsis sp.]|uniref:type IV toxin-antitoxin system AbiEi family antitoxin domain-containing protein n=1 Tax=Amycolatopsis sp. TaxID=37632 RepID=UPI002C7004D9|nr:type IV toxin-antitoxin system AbiEi family antitoxin domain-containing protein [Amycolatopsis sp.]HVV12386.1 type IV toxin-antitoxin system AbiEi family antitoxin domain-containing protein [Amycolatopsis sp.]